MSVFEAIMFTSFSLAWCTSIYKSLRTRATGGKSIIFMFIILAGCAAGILHKIYYRFDNVIYLYFVNFILISIDIGLYFRNKNIKVK